MNYNNKVKINDNSITIMNHTIKMNDMIEQTYFNVNNTILNNFIIFNKIYYDNLNNNDKKKWYKFTRTDYFKEVDKAIIINPLYPNLNSYSNNDNFLIMRGNICNKFKQEYYEIDLTNDCTSYCYLYWIFNKTLKFKIKQERYTRTIRNELDIANNKIKILEKERYYIWTILTMLSFGFFSLITKFSY